MAIAKEHACYSAGEGANIDNHKTPKTDPYIRFSEVRALDSPLKTFLRTSYMTTTSISFPCTSLLS